MAGSESPGVDAVTSIRAEVGEGPVWDDGERILWWVDLLAGFVHRTDPQTGETTTRRYGRPVGSVALRRGGGHVLADRDGFCLLAGDGSVDRQIAFLPDGHRMNDAKVDPAGRFLAGSAEFGFAPQAGALHSLEPDGSRRVLLDGLTLPNGLGWSPDGDRFYLVDSEQGWLRSWSYDPGDGSLGPARDLVLFTRPGEVPDGLCVDAQGALWVAIWGGSRVERYSPDGDLLATLQLPVTQPSSCAFGGAGLITLFITSAHRGLAKGGTPIDGALDGALLATVPGASGVPTSFFEG
jgi:sugar lactone lactonase YvrE